MTEQQKRIKLAKACGLDLSRDPLPDYFRDLNDIHQACSKLDDPLAIRFRCVVTQMGLDHNFDPFLAEAKWRAEGLGRVLKLW